MNSPCTDCYIHGQYYSPSNEKCRRCEYNIAIQLLKKMLITNNYCSLCEHRVRLGGGYWDCNLTESTACEDEKNYCIDWKAAFDEYDIEYEE